MGRISDTIDEAARAFIDRQHLFFVATAPLDGEGLLNLSPKGLDTFAVLDDHRVAYLDLTGSGVETIAHLRENGRIVVMFCAFEGPPNILRLYGRGRVVLPDDPGFEDLAARFPSYPGVRSVIVVDVSRVSDTCGYGVPKMAYQGERTQLPAWAKAKGAEGLDDYRATRNARSLDGLPGI